MPGISLDLIWNILLRLPATCIHRFRTVCKSWKTLIDSSLFIQAQIANSARINDRLIIVSGETKTRLYGVLLHSPEEQTVVGVIKLDYPMRDRDEKVNLLGSCNGLICLENTNIDPDCEYNSYTASGMAFTLWNPCTRIYRIIPDLSNLSQDLSFLDSCSYFVYDHMMNDYNVIRVTMRAKGHGFVVDIYSLKNDSWTKIRNNQIPNEWVVIAKSGVFIDGILYLITTNTRNERMDIQGYGIDEEYEYDEIKIIVFDMATRNFSFIKLPPDYYAFFYEKDRVETILSDVESIELLGSLNVLDCPLLCKKIAIVRLVNDEEGETGSKIETRLLSVVAACRYRDVAFAGEEGMILCDNLLHTSSSFVERDVAVCLKTIASPYLV